MIAQGRRLVRGWGGEHHGVGLVDQKPAHDGRHLASPSKPGTKPSRHDKAADRWEGKKMRIYGVAPRHSGAMRAHVSTCQGFRA